MNNALPDSPKEILGSLVALVTAAGALLGWRSGGLGRSWSMFISLLAAPVERDLAQREAKALRADNLRLQTENDSLRSRCYGESSGGSSSDEGGVTPISPLPSSPPT